MEHKNIEKNCIVYICPYINYAVYATRIYAKYNAEKTGFGTEKYKSECIHTSLRQSLVYTTTMYTIMKNKTITTKT